MVMLVFSVYIKHMEDIFHFYKAEDFMFQILKLNEIKALDM